MGECPPPRIKSVAERIFHEVGNAGGVNVAKAEETLGEKGGIQMCSEQGTKLTIEDGFRTLANLLALALHASI